MMYPAVSMEQPPTLCPVSTCYSLGSSRPNDICSCHAGTGSITRGTSCWHGALCAHTVPSACHCCAAPLGSTLNRLYYSGGLCSLQLFLLYSYRQNVRLRNTIYEFERYLFAVFQPADVWFGFAAGCTGQGVFTADVSLCAVDVLHPLRIGCNQGRSELQIWQSCWIIYNLQRYFRL